MKTRKDIRIVFLGTPGFAVTALDRLIQNEFNVVAVVTNIDKKSGRGMKLRASAVKEYAVQNNIPVLQPKNLKSLEFIEELASYKADLQVVVAFRMLPVVVWNQPPLGTINIHASLLPNYRGAAPINWAIINGETKTGVTTFQLKHEIDTGDIILQKAIDILPNDTAGSLHDKLANLGGELICETVDGLISKNISAVQQQFQEHDKKAPKIFKEHCNIDWHQKAIRIHNFIRGLSPYPTAYTLLNEKKLKIFEAYTKADTHQHETGKIESDNKTYIRIAATDGWIYLNEIQLEGKKRMSVEDFLRGNSITNGK